MLFTVFPSVEYVVFRGWKESEKFLKLLNELGLPSYSHLKNITLDWLAYIDENINAATRQTELSSMTRIAEINLRDYSFETNIRLKPYSKHNALLIKYRCMYTLTESREVLSENSVSALIYLLSSWIMPLYNFVCAFTASSSYFSIKIIHYSPPY